MHFCSKIYKILWIQVRFYIKFSRDPRVVNNYTTFDHSSKLKENPSLHQEEEEEKEGGTAEVISIIL